MNEKDLSFYLLVKTQAEGSAYSAVYRVDVVETTPRWLSGWIVDPEGNRTDAYIRIGQSEIVGDPTHLVCGPDGLLVPAPLPNGLVDANK